jgi:uncharacterized membrane protein SirB2
MYDIIKHIHMLTAVISGLGLLIRGILVQMDHRLMKQRWIKIAPHINDTILLACAIYLAVNIFTPLGSQWLYAKVIGLILYIVLGTFAIKRGKTKQVKLIFLVLAMITFVYILAVAGVHSPWPF